MVSPRRGTLTLVFDALQSPPIQGLGRVSASPKPLLARTGWPTPPRQGRYMCTCTGQNPEQPASRHWYRGAHPGNTRYLRDLWDQPGTTRDLRDHWDRPGSTPGASAVVLLLTWHRSGPHGPLQGEGALLTRTLLARTATGARRTQTWAASGHKDTGQGRYSRSLGPKRSSQVRGAS